MATTTKMFEHCSGGTSKQNLMKGEIRIIKFREKIKPLSTLDNSSMQKFKRIYWKLLPRFCKRISHKMIVHNIDFLQSSTAR